MIMVPGVARTEVAEDRFKFADFVLDASRRTLARAGRVVHVQPKTFDLLSYLVRHPDRLITRDELLDAVWHDQVVTHGAVARAVREVRKVLDDDATNPRFVETVQRTGYRFICPVEPATRRGGRLLLGATLAVAAVVAAALLYGLSREREGSGPPQAATDVAALNAERFFRLGLDRLSRRSSDTLREAQEYFLRAIETDPRHSGAMAGLAVARILGLPWWPITTQDALAVARPLTDRALEINPDEGFAYAALGLAFMMDGHYDEAEAHLRRAISLDPELADAHTWLATVQSSDGSLRVAIDTIRRGLLQNPAHSSAVGNLAQLLVKAGRYDEAEELIASQAELEDAKSAMTYPRGILERNRGELGAAIRLYAESVETNPDSAFFASALGGLLAEVGLSDAGRPWIERNLASCTGRPGEAAAFWRRAGHPERSEEVLYQSLAARDAPLNRAPISVLQGLAVTAIQTGDLGTGIELLRQLYPRPGDVVGWQGDFTIPALHAQYLAYALRASGAEGDALRYVAQIRAEVEKRRRNGYRQYAPLTIVEARNELLLGNREKAVDLLRVAVQEGYRGLYDLRVDPLWMLLDGYPEYERIKSRIAAELADVREALANDGTLERLARLITRLAPIHCDRDA